MKKITKGQYKANFETLFVETDKEFQVGDRVVYAPHSEVIKVEADIQSGKSQYFGTGVVWEVVLKKDDEVFKTWFDLRTKKEATELLDEIKEFGFIKRPMRDLAINR